MLTFFPIIGIKINWLLFLIGKKVVDSVFGRLLGLKRGVPLLGREKSYN
jgi:hypothetical protein